MLRRVSERPDSPRVDADDAVHPPVGLAVDAPLAAFGRDCTSLTRRSSRLRPSTGDSSAAVIRVEGAIG